MYDDFGICIPVILACKYFSTSLFSYIVLNSFNQNFSCHVKFMWWHFDRSSVCVFRQIEQTWRNRNFLVPAQAFWSQNTTSNPFLLYIRSQTCQTNKSKVVPKSAEFKREVCNTDKKRLKNVLQLEFKTMVKVVLKLKGVARLRTLNWHKLETRALLYTIIYYTMKSNTLQEVRIHNSVDILAAAYLFNKVSEVFISLKRWYMCIQRKWQLAN